MPAPRDITQLRAFLGLINFYGSFIPQMSTRTAHLNALLRKDQQWQWTKQAEQEFNSLKKTLTAETLLTHYTPDLPIVVAADASELVECYSTEWQMDRSARSPTSARR